MPIAINQLTAVPLPGPAAPGFAGGMLDIDYVQQSQDYWCWAACGEMLFEYLGPQPMSQCSLASARFGLTCCGPVQGGCDLGCWPDDSYDNHGMSIARIPGRLDQGHVEAELDAGRPVQVCYEWSGGGTHVALIVGKHPTGDFEVFDPLEDRGPGPRAFDQIESAYGEGDVYCSFTFEGN